MVREYVNGREVINQPAGHVEPHERLADAALRETREETGFDVRLLGLIGLSTYYAESSNITFHRVSFKAELMTNQPDYDLDPEIIGTKWMSLDEISSCDHLRSPMVLRDVELATTGSLYPLEILWENSTIPTPNQSETKF